MLLLRGEKSNKRRREKNPERRAILKANEENDSGRSWNVIWRIFATKPVQHPQTVCSMCSLRKSQSRGKSSCEIPLRTSKKRIFRRSRWDNNLTHTGYREEERNTPQPCDRRTRKKFAFCECEASWKKCWKCFCGLDFYSNNADVGGAAISLLSPLVLAAQFLRFSEGLTHKKKAGWINEWHRFYHFILHKSGSDFCVE